MSHNTRLHREIKNGLEFSALFPVGKNISTNLGYGDTFHSVKTMKNWVHQYYGQCSRIAPILKRTTLGGTSSEVYSFLYNHIQYKQDEVLQQVKTPANSWLNRAVGIDCKSYSVFASSILMCLGIKHYIRQIKQPLYKPHRYTHVYVVVPYDQTTGNLSEGYYVIDATVRHNREPLFTKKDDTFMDKLPHVGLNGTRQRVNPKAKRKTKTKVTARTKKVVTPRKRKKSVPRKKAGLGKTLLLGLGAIVGISQLTK